MFWDVDKSIMKNLSEFANEVTGSLSNLVHLSDLVAVAQHLEKIERHLDGLDKTSLSLVVQKLEQMSTVYDEIVEKTVRTEAIDALREENAKQLAAMTEKDRRIAEMERLVQDYEEISCLGCPKKRGALHSLDCKWRYGDNGPGEVESTVRALSDGAAGETGTAARGGDGVPAGGGERPEGVHHET